MSSIWMFKLGSISKVKNSNSTWIWFKPMFELELVKKKIQNLEFSLAWLDSLVQPNLSSNSSSISSSWSWDPTQVNYQAILSISYYQAHWIWISNSNSQLVKILIRYEFIFKLIQNLLVITTYTNGPLSLF